MHSAALRCYYVLSYHATVDSVSMWNGTVRAQINVDLIMLYASDRPCDYKALGYGYKYKVCCWRQERGSTGGTGSFIKYRTPGAQ